MKNVRIGLLGAGFVLDGFHVPALRALNAEIAAVAARSEGRVNDFAGRWGIGRRYHGEGAIERLCKDPDLDAVLIALPNDLHLRAVELASENHKAIICEKPLARDSEEAARALSAVRRYGVLHCYAENQLFIPQIVRASKLIRDGAIGRVTWVRSREAHSGPHSDWFWSRERAGGGVMLDMGSHSVEITRHLFGKKPSGVCAWTGTLVHRTEVEDNSLVLADYEGMGLGQSENSWSAKGGLDIRLEVQGSEGSIFIDTTRETGIRLFTVAAGGGAGYIVEKADAKEGWLYPSWEEYVTHGYLGEMRDFVGAISEGREASETFDDGFLINTVIDSAYRSSREKRWIGL